MNILTDLIYFSFIAEEERRLLRSLYEAEPAIFLHHLNMSLDIEFQNKVLDSLDLPGYKRPLSDQNTLYQILTEVATYLHTNLTDDGRHYWLSRGVTFEQLAQFKLGDNGCWLKYGAQSFFKALLGKYSTSLVDQVYVSLQEQINTASRLFGDGHAVCCPTFDAIGLCRGLVYRNLHYVPNPTSLKNMFKFYNPCSWSYLFNFETVEKYDEFYLVEGVFDALALQRAGYPNVISPSMVKLSEYHCSVLRGKKLHVIFDGDNGGLYGLRFIKDHLDEANLLTLALCPTTKDIDELSEVELSIFMKNLPNYDVRKVLKSR